MGGIFRPFPLDVPSVLGKLNYIIKLALICTDVSAQEQASSLPFVGDVSSSCLRSLPSSGVFGGMMNEG